MKKSLIRKLLSMATVLCIVMTSFVSGAAVALAATAEDGNLLANGDFEAGAGGWMSNGCSIQSVDKETTPEGVFAGEGSLLVPAPRTAGTSYPYQSIAVEANKTYISSVNLKLKENVGSTAQQTAQLYIAPNGTGTNVGDGVVQLYLEPKWATATRKLETTAAGSVYVGVAQWSNVASFYMDEFYFGELQLKDINITVDGGANAIDANEKSSFQLGAEFLNQLNTNYGLEEATVTKWELTEAVPGVSINETTGVVTTTSEVEANSIGVRVTVEPKFTGAPATIIFEKNLSVIPYDVIAATNMIANGGFENGISGWSLQGSNWNITSVDKATTPAGVRSGNGSVLVPIRSGSNYPYQTVQLQAEKTYLASAAVKVDEIDHANKNQTATLYFNPSTIATASPANLVEDWKTIEGIITTSNNTSMAVGIAQWTGVASFYLDDVYLGELKANDINITVDGESNVIDMQIAKGAKTFQLSGEVLNQLNTNKGLENAVVSKWELTEAVSGVSINEQTGALTVTPAAQATSIGIRAIIAPNFTGAPATCAFEKTLQLIPASTNVDTNMIVNGGFENGTTSSWQLQGSWTFSVVDKATNSDGVHSGNYAALIPFKASACYPYQYVNVEANKTYISSVALKFDRLNTEITPNRQSALLYLAPQSSCATASTNSVLLDNEEWKISTGTAVTSAAGRVLVGTAQWNGYTSYYVDDFYFGELYVKDVNIIGEDNAAAINVPAGTEGKVVELKAEILNQLNTTEYLSQNITKWELTEAVEGVSIDAATGKLTVAPTVTAEEIGVRVTFEQDFTGALDNDYVFEKTLEVNVPDKVVYKAENGTVISDGQLPNGKVTSTVTFTNKAQEDVNVVIYNAIYKKLGEKIQLFKTVIKDNLTVIPGDTLIYTEENIDSIADASEYVLKTFVWTDAFMPLMSSGGLE